MSSNADSPEVGERVQDRFRGVMLGLAAGDALGAPMEFQPPSAPTNIITEMVGGGWQQLPPGHWTDDTQMTLCVVESLLAKRVFDPDDIARRFVQWMLGKPNDLGIHTGHVLEAIHHGEPWEQASRRVQEQAPNNAPNGSLMRCAPLALFFYRHPDYVASLSPVLSRITHSHPDCESACVFLNVVIAHLINGLPTQESIETAYDACDTASPELKERINRAMQPTCEVSPTGYVLDTLEVALWSFLHTTTLEGALVSAINRGADANTVGAVTGALAGARYGMSGIPSRWLTSLSESDYFVRCADSLLDLAEHGP